jgi:1-acyl-sn-glycerol-3-phosphate acyltransferase
MAGMPPPEPATGSHPGWGASNAADAAAPARAARGFRLAQVIAAFGYFGLGIWALGTFVAPLVTLAARVAGRSEDGAQRLVQRAVHRFFQSFVFWMERVAHVAHVEFANPEAFPRGPALVVANHPSIVDTPLLGAALPQADFIVGPEWLRNSWMRRAIRLAGYLRAEDGAANVRLAAERLRSGRTLVVYPEGSRSTPDGLRRFQRGAAHIALEAGCDILPVVIYVKPHVLYGGDSWRDFPTESPRWRVEVGEPIPCAARPGESRPLAARRLTGVLEDHFQKRWERGRN